ncbi:ComF family protein [Ornithinibacillus halophilus]|uniref:Competence protein ComFC n=1 Tax=Ornithinibacillus halophilus TaxID=930117 RepID=A0A1M5FCY4_9BACI|nr:ComF family protein [Ornithinibacillus halophilus]SHF89339.1 competence protein ComFC [Ornithinibacillus halophilus]
MKCTWCFEEIIVDVNWSTLIPKPPTYLCDTCENKLVKITGQRCMMCSRESKMKLCSDCTYWKEHYKGEDPLTSNYSLFTYNQHMQDMIAKWKYRGDYEVGKAFQSYFSQGFKQKFSKMKNIIAVPIPLSEERLEERRFNQALMLAEALTIPCEEILERDHSEKQSKKTRYQRISSENPFKLKKTINKSVILVDDIYTTGTTIRHAASLFKQVGCEAIYAYTLIRG